MYCFFNNLTKRRGQVHVTVHCLRSERISSQSVSSEMYSTIMIIFLLRTVETSGPDKDARSQQYMFEYHLPYTFQKHINTTADRKMWFEYLEQLLTVLQQPEGRNNIQVTELASVF